MKNHLLLALLLTATVGLAAQTSNTHSLRGTLADQQSGEPLRYANCVLLHAADSAFAYGTTSNEQGTFHFRHAAAGSYLLRINYMGYQPYYQPIELHADADLGRLALAKSATVLDAVKGTAPKTPPFRPVPPATPSRTPPV